MMLAPFFNPWKRFSKRGSWRDKYTTFMLFWSVVSQVWLFIQGARIHELKDSSGTSPYALAILLTSAIAWLIYGGIVLQPRDRVIIMSSCVLLVGGIFLLISYLSYI